MNVKVLLSTLCQIWRGVVYIILIIVKQEISCSKADEEIEKQEAERRMKSGKSDPEVNLPQGKRAPQVRNIIAQKADPSENFRRGSLGKESDIIAKKAGVSDRTVEKFKRIQEKFLKG